MSELKVHLADAPTDVLVHLVDHGPETVSGLVAAVVPDGAVDARAAVAYAIDLLRRIGYVRAYDGEYRWAATERGLAAVETARQAVTA